jgi:hypothetical protein
LDVLLMAGIRLVDKRLTRRAGDWEQCTLFVLGSQYVLLYRWVLSVFDPQCPKLNLAVS